MLKKVLKANSYLSISKELLDGQIKKDMTLSKKEAKILKKFVKSKKQSTKHLKHLHAAFGKHKCITVEKSAFSLKKWPNIDAVGDWYIFDCKKGQVSTKPGKKQKHSIKPGKKTTKKPGKSKHMNSPK